MTRSSSTIIVTGAAGFIGAAVARALLLRGARVVGIDNFEPYYARAIKDENVALAAASAKTAGQWALVERDITDESAMRELLARERPEGMIHLAGKAGVRPSLADPVGYMRTNVLGSQVLMAAAAAAGCGRVVLASSSSVYGNASRVPFSESDTATEPISPYAASKRGMELAAHTHAHLTGMPTACLRFFTVYGPRQRPDLAISLFMHKIARGEPITMFGDGSMSRDFTYIDDIVSGVLAAYDRIGASAAAAAATAAPMGTAAASAPPFRIWNLGNSHPVMLRDMIATIGRVVGKEPRIEHKPMQPGDVDRTFADLTRSRAELGYEPRMGFEEGVGRQWEWMRGRGFDG